MHVITHLTGLAYLLVQLKLLDETQAKQALQHSQQLSIPLPHYLVKNHLLDSETIAQCCAQSLGMLLYDLTQFDSTALTLNIVPKELMLRYHIIPLAQKNTFLHLGMTDPTDQTTIDRIAFHTGFTIIPVLVREKELMQLFETCFHQPSFLQQLEYALSNEFTHEEKTLTVNEKIVHYDEPVIQLVDYILKSALEKAASDIHIEPFEKESRIRYRKDSILYEITTLSTAVAIRLITRLKVMAKLDTAERRLPQDGHLRLHDTDIRISTCPMLFGEKIVLRIMYAENHFLDIHHLGLTQTQKKLFLEKIHQPQGLILVTGPTGSGKTVSLYAAIRELNTLAKNISTVEDPIEIRLHGINQVNIHPKIGLDFATVLRAFLRQDPDIIMVGEIRDKETADTAIQAAQTGHLVLSTLHTNSASETLTRLQSMGVEDYLIKHAITLIIAQRLIRKLCDHCKTLEMLPPTLQQKYQIFEPVFHAASCEHCLHGYNGRTAIYEFLTVSAMHTQEKFPTLLTEGIEKVRRGETSLAEIYRVLQCH